MLKLFKALAMALCFFCLGLSSNGNTLKANVNKRKVVTGEIFSYTVKIEGNFSQPKLTPPEFKNFRIASQSQSRNYSFKEKVEKITIEITYFLFAAEAGTYRIEPAVIEDKGKKYQSKPIAIKVRGKPLKDNKKILPYIKKGTEL